MPDWRDILTEMFGDEIVPPALIKELEVVGALVENAGGYLVSRQILAAFVVNWAARNGVSYKIARLVR